MRKLSRGEKQVGVATNNFRGDQVSEDICMHYAPVVYFGYRGNAWILHEYVIRSSQDPQLERLSGAIPRPLWPACPFQTSWAARPTANRCKRQMSSNFESLKQWHKLMSAGQSVRTLEVCEVGG
jgi:hypothetical protein